MKMGNIASPWRYDFATCVAPQSPKLRCPAIPRYASMPTREAFDWAGPRLPAAMTPIVDMPQAGSVLPSWLSAQQKRSITEP